MGILLSLVKALTVYTAFNIRTSPLVKDLPFLLNIEEFQKTALTP